MFLKKDIKNITKKIIYNSGLASFLLSCNKHKLLILCHHKVLPPRSKLKYLGVSQDIFEQQIIFLKKYFKIASFKEGIESLKTGSIKESLLVLNFDDGYRDNYLYAFPILKKHGITATIFLTTGFIETKERFWWDIVADAILNSPHLKEKEIEKIDMVDGINNSLQKMSPKERNIKIEEIKKKFEFNGDYGGKRDILNWEEIKEMSRYGIEFGSHTITHPDLTLLGEDELIREISMSKQVLEGALGKEILGFAYPHGFYNDDARKIVKKSNYLYARTMLNGFNNMNEDIFELKCVSGFSYALYDLPARLSYRGF